MKIVVVGLGYVGLSNVVLLAQNNEVIGVDTSQEKVDAVNSRKSPFLDLELSAYMEEHTLNLSASMDLKKSLSDANYVIVSTPTNYDDKTNNFDTSLVESVIFEIIKHEPKACIVVKSTVPIGFTDRINAQIGKRAVMFSPEFLREGRALYDNLNPSRIVIGENSKRAAHFAFLLQQGAVKKNIEVLFTGPKEAEAIKLFSNTYLAMRVAFFNELDNYAIASDLNSSEIVNGVSLDPRIGNHYNNPSFGYGGYCLPKDTKQLLAEYEFAPQNLITAIIDSNQIRKKFLAEEIIKRKPKTVGVYRLIMKAGSDNFRDNAVQDIMTLLSDAGIALILYEPNLCSKTYSCALLERNLAEFKKKSDIVIANRISDEIKDIEVKVFTRDLFNKD